MPAGTVAVDGDEAVLPLTGELDGGGHAVRWKVVSGDGHPISGAFTFTVGDGGPPPPDLESGAPADAADADSTTAPTPGQAASGQVPASSATVRVAWLAVAGALVGVFGYTLLLRLRRRSK
ncbi:copper resistance CopC family protein [Streptomonospora mangrovi]|uniref:copper resistance CopC family protein n=1 Tax=Streptomonospora mangrovi TaxID=2883123 RepID=UPI0022DD0095|nr:copper resistance protein CopC [Streptomonospora mangrovi]